MNSSDAVTIARLLSMELRHLLCDGKPQQAFEIAEILALLPENKYDKVKETAVVGLLASFLAKNDVHKDKRHLKPLVDILLKIESVEAA